VTAFDILSAFMLSTCSTKGPVMTAKHTPWMQPWFHHTIKNGLIFLSTF